MSRTIFPGQDLNNARIQDFIEVDKWAANNPSRAEAPRMPWHDVHSMLVGPAVLDIAQHFVERASLSFPLFLSSFSSSFPLSLLPSRPSPPQHFALSPSSYRSLALLERRRAVGVVVCSPSSSPH